jgi:hypothetical protein
MYAIKIRKSDLPLTEAAELRARASGRNQDDVPRDPSREQRRQRDPS